jgi:hypothetical protein
MILLVQHEPEDRLHRLDGDFFLLGAHDRDYVVLNTIARDE